MKAGKAYKNKGPQLIELTGKLVRKQFGKGSKSEHDSIILESEKESYVIRRIGGNPFKDPVLEKLVGKKVKVTGFVDQYTFMARDIKEEK